MPVYFGYPKQQIYNIYFDIPTGYVVESLPKSIRIATENKNAVYEMSANSEKNKIHIQVTKAINSSIFAVDEYETLKGFFQKSIVSQNEKIVLKKI
jgi:hypothetical protein